MHSRDKTPGMFNNGISLDLLTRKEHSIEVALHNTQKRNFQQCSVVKCSAGKVQCTECKKVQCSEGQYSAVYCNLLQGSVGNCSELHLAKAK